MTFFCGIYGWRGFWHQIEGDQQVPSILVTARELRYVCVPIYRAVSVYISADFNFTASFFVLYLHISAYKENKEIMNSNKEIYIVLKFSVVCYVIFLLLAVLLSRLWKGSCSFGVLKDVKFRGHLPLFVNLNCGSSTRSACIKVCKFRCCLMFWRCINWYRPLLDWLDYCSDWNTVDGSRVEFIVKKLGKLESC
jgi:hypothetical protein